MDEGGNTAEDTLVITVRDTEPPVAVIGDDIIVDQGETVVLDGTRSKDNTGIVEYHWTFEYGGNNISIMEPAFNFTFQHTGDYKIWLSVVDAAGNVGDDHAQLMVMDISSPEAKVTIPPEVDRGTPVLLDGSGSVDNVGIEGYLWTFVYNGKLHYLNGSVVSFTFQQPGEYHIVLEVWDQADHIDREEVTLTVRKVHIHDGKGEGSIWIFGLAVLTGLALATVSIKYAIGRQND
jgi:hypothetical protein